MIKLGMERIFTQGRIWLKQAYLKMEEIGATEFTSEPGSQPTTPPEDCLYFYAKESASGDVSALWWKDDLGVEHEVGASGGAVAPSTADYLVKTANAGLSAERVVTDTATITWDWSTAGQAKANVVGSVGGSAWSVLTNGDPVTPELIFDSNGDVVMTEICNGAMC